MNIILALNAARPLLNSLNALEEEAHAVVESKELEAITSSRISIAGMGAVICRSSKYHLQEPSSACGWVVPHRASLGDELHLIVSLGEVHDGVVLRGSFGGIEFILPRRLCQCIPGGSGSHQGDWVSCLHVFSHRVRQIK